MEDEKPTKRGPGQNWNDPRENGTCETVANNEKFNIVSM